MTTRELIILPITKIHNFCHFLLERLPSFTLTWPTNCQILSCLPLQHLFDIYPSLHSHHSHHPSTRPHPQISHRYLKFNMPKIKLIFSLKNLFSKFPISVEGISLFLSNPGLPPQVPSYADHFPLSTISNQMPHLVNSCSTIYLISFPFPSLT